MRYLFGPGYEERFKTFLASRPLLAFDFDGTLSPLVEQPALAQAGPETRRLLARLATVDRVVLLSVSLL
jgi:trehalose 6-phosphate phosphatase